MRALADRVALSWVPAQREDGWFRDPVTGYHLGGYGLDMIGNGLLRTGTRLGDPQAVATGRRAVVAAAEAPEAPGAFAILSRAVTLTDDEASAALDDASRAALLQSIGGFVRPRVGERAQPCDARPACYSNLKLVDATATLRLLQTGAPVVRADARIARPSSSRAAAERMLARRVPAVMDFSARLLLFGGRTINDAGVMSDPRQYPLAYHSLSAAMYAHALGDLRRRPSVGERRTLRAALDALSGIVAPDGELSYMGRGDGQVWVPAAALYAATVGSRMFAADAERSERYRAVAAAMLAILEGRAGARGQPGFLLVPGAESRTSYAGIDHYANAVTYNGLALFFLNMAADAARRAPSADGPLPAQHSRFAFIDAAAAGIAAVRRGPVWFAVHDAQTHPTDLRCDFGLLRAKVFDGARWTDLLERRPLTEGAGMAQDSAGPVLLTAAGPALPEGRMTLRPGGAVEVRGGWRLGRRIVRRATFSFRPKGAGVVLRVSGVRRGDRLRLLAFTAGPATVGVRQLSAGALRLRTSEDLQVARRAGFASATAERLTRYELIAQARRAGTFTVTWQHRTPST